jgi:hypothetical protein
MQRSDFWNTFGPLDGSGDAEAGSTNDGRVYIVAAWSLYNESQDGAEFDRQFGSHDASPDFSHRCDIALEKTRAQ